MARLIELEVSQIKHAGYEPNDYYEALRENINKG